MNNNPTIQDSLDFIKTFIETPDQEKRDQIFKTCSLKHLDNGLSFQDFPPIKIFDKDKRFIKSIPIQLILMDYVKTEVIKSTLFSNSINKVMETHDSDDWTYRMYTSGDPYVLYRDTLLEENVFPHKDGYEGIFKINTSAISARSKIWEERLAILTKGNIKGDTYKDKDSKLSFIFSTLESGLAEASSEMKDGTSSVKPEIVKVFNDFASMTFGLSKSQQDGTALTAFPFLKDFLKNIAHNNHEKVKVDNEVEDVIKNSRELVLGEYFLIATNLLKEVNSQLLMSTLFLSAMKSFLDNDKKTNRSKNMRTYLMKSLQNLTPTDFFKNTQRYNKLISFLKEESMIRHNEKIYEPLFKSLSEMKSRCDTLNISQGKDISHKSKSRRIFSM